MSEKKLEEFFASVKYTYLSDNKLEIIINDEKIPNMSLETFHIVLGKSLLYIYLNDSYPIFKVQKEKKFLMKEYHYNIDEKCLILTITGYDYKESVASFKRKWAFRQFFKFVLGSIYSRYHYRNSILLYFESLKKKSIESLKLYYYTQLKDKIALAKLNSYSKFMYSKVFIFKNQVNSMRRNYFNQKKIQFMFKTFFGNIAIKKVNKEENESKSIKSVEHLALQLKRKALKGIAYQKEVMTQYNSLANIFHLNGYKSKALLVLLKYHSFIRMQKDRILRYNRMNYAFLDILSNRFVKEGYLLKINSNKELILAFLALLKNNKLKVLYTSTKLARLAILSLQKNKVIRYKQIKAQKRLILYKKRNEIEIVFRILANKLFYKKICYNKKMLMNCVSKQHIYQLFLARFAFIFSNKLRKINTNKKWEHKQAKFRLFEFLSSLFLSKTLNETKVVCKKVTSSFEIVSLRLLTKKRKKMIQALLIQNYFNKFKGCVRILKFHRIIRYKKHYIIKKDKKQSFTKFIAFQKKEALLRRKEREMEIKGIMRFFKTLKSRVQLTKWSEAAIMSYQEKLHHLSLIALYHYSKFKKEKTFRDNYFNSKLNKMLKKHYFNKYFIKSAVMFKCIKVIQIIHQTNHKRRMINLTKKQIARNCVKEVIEYSYQIKLIQMMHQAAHVKNKLNQKSKHIQTQNNNTQINWFIRSVMMRKKIRKHFYSKIKLFNIKCTFEKINSVIKCKYINHSLHKKLYSIMFLSCFRSDNRLRDKLKQRKGLLLKKIPFIYFKSISNRNNKCKQITAKYSNYIIKKIFLKPSKTHKLVRSLSPLIKYNKIITIYYFLRQLKFIYLSKKLIDKRRAITIKAFFQDRLFDNQYSHTIKKLIRLFNIKHNVKHFMIIVLDKIKKELILGKQRRLLVKKSLRKLKQRDEARTQGNSYLKKHLELVQLNQKKFQICSFFNSINRNRYTQQIRLKKKMIIEKKKRSNYIQFFVHINILFQGKKKAKIIHQRFLNEMIGFLNRIKYQRIISNQISFLSIKTGYRQFIIRSINSINNNALSVRRKKFIQIKHLTQLYSLIQNKKSLKSIRLSQAKYQKIIRDKQLKKFYKKFIKEAFFIKKEKTNLKRKLFEMLKENRVTSKEINYYLNQAEALMT